VTPRRALLQAAPLLPALGWRGAARAQGAPLVFLGDRDLPPYEFLDGEVPRGANVELAQAIGRVLGRRVEVRLMGWAEAQRRLLAGEGDALTMLGRSEQREAQFDFSLPTMPAPFAFFVPADQERLFVARSRFGGVRVAVTQGGLAAELLAASHPEAEGSTGCGSAPWMRWPATAGRCAACWFSAASAGSASCRPSRGAAPTWRCARAMPPRSAGSTAPCPC
jgi:ABC-type amino acid transport substrate-binding protein